jgi:hypothetical protein
MSAMPTSPFPKTRSDEAPAAEMLSPRWPDKKALPEANAAELVGRIDEVLAVLKERTPHAPADFASSGSAIEARIAHLEASSAHLQRDVAQLRTDVREIRERLTRLQERASHLPSRGLLALSVLLLLAGMFAASGFQGQVQGFLAAALG